MERLNVFSSCFSAAFGVGHSQLIAAISPFDSLPQSLELIGDGVAHHTPSVDSGVDVMTTPRALH